MKIETIINVEDIESFKERFKKFSIKSKKFGLPEPKYQIGDKDIIDKDQYGECYIYRLAQL